MQVIAAREARLAGAAEHAALLDQVALRHVDLREVPVERGEPEPVVEDHAVAVDAEVRPRTARARGCSPSIGAPASGREVVAVVDRLGDLLVRRRSSCGARRSGSSPASSHLDERSVEERLARPTSRRSRGCFFSFLRAHLAVDLLERRERVLALVTPTRVGELGHLHPRKFGRARCALRRSSAPRAATGQPAAAWLPGAILGDHPDARIRRHVARDREQRDASVAAPPLAAGSRGRRGRRPRRRRATTSSARSTQAAPLPPRST